MAFVCVNAVLMSGRGTWITARCDWTVGELKRQAQNSLQTGRGILVNQSGEFLRDEENLLDAGVKMGDVVSLHLREVHIAATTNAFCAVLGDGRVVSWGDSKYGGDCSSVSKLLKDVKHIAASFAAFAAVLRNGSVVAWGNSGFGGNIGPVAHQLGNVERIIASCGAFAAMCADGSVVTWGHGSHGGNSRAVQHRLRNVQ
ncbi:KIF24, partial [Symbiodinium sp. CCMP2456]